MARKKKMDKLSQEVAQALACGMSYGKWKAMQEYTKLETQKALPDGWRVCEHCGMKFKLKTKREQRFCDYTCQQQAYYQNHKQELNAKTMEWRARKRNEVKSNG